MLTQECMNCGVPGQRADMRQNLPAALVAGEIVEYYYRASPLCRGCARFIRALRLGTVYLGTDEAHLLRYEITEGLITATPERVTV